MPPKKKPFLVSRTSKFDHRFFSHKRANVMCFRQRIVAYSDRHGHSGWWTFASLMSLCLLKLNDAAAASKCFQRYSLKLKVNSQCFNFSCHRFSFSGFSKYETYRYESGNHMEQHWGSPRPMKVPRLTDFFRSSIDISLQDGTAIWMFLFEEAASRIIRQFRTDKLILGCC